jgi:hypothetical protein
MIAAPDGASSAARLGLLLRAGAGVRGCGMKPLFLKFKI